MEIDAYMPASKPDDADNARQHVNSINKFWSDRGISAGAQLGKNAVITSLLPSQYPYPDGFRPLKIKK